MQMITVATFNTAAPAERLKEMLEGEGVMTKIRDQSRLQRFWFLAKPYAAYHVDVAKETHSQAVTLLAEWQESQRALAEALRCPQCGSLQLEYPHMTRNFFLPTLIAHVMTFFGVMKHHFYCVDCQNTWRWPSKAGALPVTSPH